MQVLIIAKSYESRNKQEDSSKAWHEARAGFVVWTAFQLVRMNHVICCLLWLES